MRNYEIAPISGSCGAEIYGIDLRRDLDEKTVSVIRQALLDYLVVFFRDQTLSPDDQIAFGRRFGELLVDRFTEPLDGYPEMIELIKEPEETVNFGRIWHSDSTYESEPPLGSILYALEVPPFGGDTLWANQYLAYETLSDGMKKLLERLRAVHSGHFGYGTSPQRIKYKSIKLIDRNYETAEEMVHPVVRTHPETGRKALYVNEGYTKHFDGMTIEESRPILEYLKWHCVRPEFTCRFRWTKGAIAFWDNRAAQHLPINDYTGFRRHMRRITIRGDRPF